MNSPQLDLFTNCQRWRRRRPGYRPAGEVFDPRYAEVHLIDDSDAKRFVEEHHFSGTYVAARLRIGLVIKPPFEKERLGGVAVLSVSMSPHVLPRWLGVDSIDEGVELGRFVLLDHPYLAANAESWFLARCLRLAKARLPRLRGVVSFVDPVERRDEAGTLIKRGHTGVSLRAANAQCVGRSSPRTHLLLPNGRVLSPRAISKLRNGERGAGYCERQLREAGAPRRDERELVDTYLLRLRAAGFLRTMKHPGNWVFRWNTEHL